jgi:hypothetical protein
VAETAAAVGVPLITPVDVLIDSPAGSDGDTANTRVPAMPVVVYAVVDVMAVPTVPVTVCAAGVIVVFADTGIDCSGSATDDTTSATTDASFFMAGGLRVKFAPE